MVRSARKSAEPGESRQGERRNTLHGFCGRRFLWGDEVPDCDFIQKNILDDFRDVEPHSSKLESERAKESAKKG